MTSPAWMLVAFFGYMAFILAVGIVAGRRTKGGMESFYLGDRRVGAWVTAISASASSESGWLVLGCVAMGYIYGVSGYWITLGCVLGFAFNWFFFAERVRRQSAENGAITVPEFLERVTGGRSPAIRVIGVAIIFVLMFTYVAAQLTAAGVALQVTFGWATWIGVLVGAAVTVFYTTVGGYRAVSWTDLFQGLLMAAALVVLPVMALVHLAGTGQVRERSGEEAPWRIYVLEGSVEGAARTVRVKADRPHVFANEATDPPRTLRLEVEVLRREGKKAGERLVAVVDGRSTPLPAGGDGAAVLDLALIGLEGRLTEEVGGEKSKDLKHGAAFLSPGGGMVAIVLLGWILGMLGIGLGYPGSPHVVARFMAARSRREIARGRFIALGWALLAETGAISAGILARGLLPDLLNPEAALLETATFFLHPFLAGLILAAIFAALRSTADSQLLVASSAVVRDLCESVLGLEMDDARARRVSRAVVVVLGLLAVALALSETRFIFWFVLFSWAGLGASFAPPLLLAVWWRRLSPAGVVAGMVAGFATTLVWKLWLLDAVVAWGGPEVYELVPAFLLSLGACVAFSLRFPRRAADS